MPTHVGQFRGVMEEISPEILTNETFAFSEKLGKGKEVNLQREELQDDPGIVFYLEMGANTFCLRAIATDNRRETLHQIKQRNSDVLRVLKLDSHKEDFSFETFPTPSKAAAEILVDHIADRRYPLREELLCNLSDPGFNWWMSTQLNSFHIFFHSYGVDKTKNLICLGPMDDPVIACLRLAQAQPFLKKYFDIEDFSLKDNSFSARALFSHSSRFDCFKNLFLTGETELERDFFGAKGTQAKTLSLYFQELTLKRRFWRQLTEKFEFLLH